MASTPPSTPPDDWRRARRDVVRRRRRRNRYIALGAVVGSTIAVAVLAITLMLRGESASRVGVGTAAPAPTSTPAAPPPPPSTPPALAAPRRPLRFPARSVRSAVRVPVLMFHRVAARETATNAWSRDLTVTPADFAAELRWLAQNGYRPISQATLFRALFYGGRLPRRPVVLTFDDGYVDAAATIGPMLARRGWPGTFFVITGRVGERAFLTWRQIRRLDRMGMDIASHTVDHVELPSAGSAERWREITQSRRALERRLGHPVQWFAYPAGRHDTAAAADLRRAGYLLAYTTDPGSTISAADPLEAPRVRVHGEEPLADFADSVRAASG